MKLKDGPIPSEEDRVAGVEVQSDWHEGRWRRSSTTELVEGADYYHATREVLAAVNAALNLGEPLLVTGDPGTGKTQLAYFVAKQLGQERPLRFQVKSTSQASDLVYQYDAIKRLHVASARGSAEALDPRRYIEPGPLWQAIEFARVNSEPRVLLIDEIDKAPRDFPNDLLQEIGETTLRIPDLPPPDNRIELPNELRDCKPVIIITSNRERRLPGPFLRRCLYLDLVFNRKLVKRAIRTRSHELLPADAGEDHIEKVVRRLFQVRDLATTKPPSTAEAFVWMRWMKYHGVTPEELGASVSETPFLEALVKDPNDRDRVLNR